MKVQDWMASMENSMKHIKKNLHLSLSNLILKDLQGENSPKFLLWNHCHPNTKTKDTKKRELRANIFGDYKCKNSKQNISKQNPTLQKSIIHHDQVMITVIITMIKIYSRVTRMLQHTQINVIQHINKRKDKHLIISIEAKTDFDKIQHTFMTKTLL